MKTHPLRREMVYRIMQHMSFHRFTVSALAAFAFAGVVVVRAADAAAEDDNKP